MYLCMSMTIEENEETFKKIHIKLQWNSDFCSTWATTCCSPPAPSQGAIASPWERQVVSSSHAPNSTSSIAQRFGSRTWGGSLPPLIPHSLPVSATFEYWSSDCSHSILLIRERFYAIWGKLKNWRQLHPSSAPLTK